MVGREGIWKEMNEIQGFREWGRDAPDAGRFIPSRDAGIAPQEERGGASAVKRGHLGLRHNAMDSDGN